MERENNRGRGRYNRGSLTVEAAIVTPVFILVLLFVINFINIFYLQLAIQQGLNTTAEVIAEYSYGLVLSGQDISKLSLNAETKKTETELANAVKQIKDEGQKTLYVLNGNLSLDTFPVLVDSGKKLYEGVTTVTSSVKGISGDDIQSYLFSTLLDVGGGHVVQVMMDKYLDGMQVNRNLLDGNINYHVYIDNGHDNDLVFIAVYRYKHPLNIIGNNSVPMRQVVRVHPWVGGKTKGIRGSK